MTINPTKLRIELTAAGLPPGIVRSNGEILWARELTAEEQATAAQVIAAHDPTDYAAIRREAAPAELLQSPLAVMTYDEAAAWIDANVSTVATARTALKALARMVIALRNQQMSEYLD